jgi:hypothetical protein
MPAEVRGILVLRLGASVSKSIRNQFHAAIEKTCQALGIRHVIEDRRESECWTRSICMLSPTGFSSRVAAVQWDKEIACQIAERIHCQEALSSTKYCGVRIHLEEIAGQNDVAAMQEQSRELGEDTEDEDEEKGEELF